MAKRKKANSQAENKRPLRIPGNLLSPIGRFLRKQMETLERRRKSIATEDPFVSGQNESLASPDASAAQQFGHARSEALRHELDRKIIQMRKAMSRIKIGNYGICEECGNMIDTDRLMIYTEATFCVKCEAKREGIKT